MPIRLVLASSINIWLQNLYSNMHSSNPAQFYGDTLEVIVQVTPDPLTETLVLRVVINDEEKQVYIPNIFIPEDYRRQGLGFGLLKEILKVSTAYDHELYITDMTNSSYNRMLQRNAQPTNVDDAVKVDINTIL